MRQRSLSSSRPTSRRWSDTHTHTHTHGFIVSIVDKCLAENSQEKAISSGRSRGQKCVSISIFLSLRLDERVSEFFSSSFLYISIKEEEEKSKFSILLPFFNESRDHLLSLLSAWFYLSYRVSLTGFLNVVSGDDNRSAVVGTQTHQVIPDTVNKISKWIIRNNQRKKIKIKINLKRKGNQDKKKRWMELSSPLFSSSSRRASWAGSPLQLEGDRDLIERARRLSR